MATTTDRAYEASLDPVVARVENARALDGLAAGLQRVLRNVLPDGRTTDVLRGKPLGHPAHPSLVVLPIGSWLSATVADVMGERTAARRLTAVGCVTALPAAASGAAEFLSVDGPRRRVATAHAAVNNTALLCYTMSWTARRRGRNGRAFLLSLVGAAFVSAGGWLGGHLAYREGVGVDTTQFERRQAPHGTPSAEHRKPSHV